MEKKAAILTGILAMLAVVTSVGLTAMLQKPVQELPKYRTEYVEPELSEQEMKELEEELKKLEEEEKEPTSIFFKKPVQEAPEYRSEYQ